MAREKMSPGLKILWLWTIGTAAVLITSVARTRLRDMEQLVDAQQQRTAPNDSIIEDAQVESDEGTVKEVK